MDGDRAPLAALTEICADHDVWLMTDDAHGLGVLDDRSRQCARTLANGHAVESARRLWRLSLRVAPVIELLKSRARTLVYSHGPAAGERRVAAIAALDIIVADPAI